MKYRHFGNTELEVSAITFGGWPMGGSQYGPTNDDATIQAVHEDKVHTLKSQVLKLEDQVDRMMDKDKEIIEQHKKLFEALDNNQPSTGYNYN